jgi:GST-like protein
MSTPALAAHAPARWPIKHPDRLQLYALGTPNGVKIPIALEELGLPYEAHRVNIGEGEQFDEAYVRINPNGKIPSLIDPDGPGGEPIAIMESAAILLYLAEKTGKLLPADPRLRWEVLQWTFFQVGSVGPMFGQFGHFFTSAKGKTDSYGEARYLKETRRLLKVLDHRLEGRSFLVGDELSMADIATAPWVGTLEAYGAREEVGMAEVPHVSAWVGRLMERQGFQKGVGVYR